MDILPTTQKLNKSAVILHNINQIIVLFVNKIYYLTCDM